TARDGSGLLSSTNPGDEHEASCPCRSGHRGCRRPDGRTGAGRRLCALVRGVLVWNRQRLLGLPVRLDRAMPSQRARGQPRLLQPEPGLAGLGGATQMAAQEAVLAGLNGFFGWLPSGRPCGYTDASPGWLPAVSAPDTQGCGCSSGVEHDLAKVGVEGSNPFARSSSSQELNQLPIASAPRVRGSATPTTSPFTIMMEFADVCGSVGTRAWPRAVSASSTSGVKPGSA